jgi:uncharacterized membrane protein
MCLNKFRNVWDEYTQFRFLTHSYFWQFHRPSVAVVARCVGYVSGSFVAVLLLVTLFNDRCAHTSILTESWISPRVAFAKRASVH